MNADKKHIPASGRIAREAAIYLFQLCRAILEGLREEMIARGRLIANLNVFAPVQLLEGTLGVNPTAHWATGAPGGNGDGREINIASDAEASAGRCGRTGSMPTSHVVPDVTDSVTGQVLRGELVEASRREEMDYFLRSEEHHV